MDSSGPQDNVAHGENFMGRGRAWLIAGAVVLVCGYVAYQARTVFTPLLAALALAYIFNPIVSRFERRGFSRPVVIVVLFVLLGVVAIVVCAVTLFVVIDQITDLVIWLPEKLPILAERISERFPDVSNKVVIRLKETLGSKEFAVKLEELVSTYAGPMFRSAADVIGSVIGSLWVVVNLVILIPLYTFFLLWRFDRVLQVLAEIIPVDYRQQVIYIASKIDRTLASFFRGRLVACAVVGALTAVGYLIAGVPFAVLLGILLGVLNIVPFLVVIVGLPITLVMCYANYLDLAHPFYALIVFAIVQGVDNFVLSPMLGKSVGGLSPVTTVIVLLIGSQLAGLFGMFVAIPIAAVVKNLFTEFVLPELAEITGPLGPVRTGDSSGDHQEDQPEE